MLKSNAQITISEPITNIIKTNAAIIGKTNPVYDLIAKITGKLPAVNDFDINASELLRKLGVNEDDILSINQKEKLLSTEDLLDPTKNKNTKAVIIADAEKMFPSISG